MTSSRMTFTHLYKVREGGRETAAKNARLTLENFLLF